MLPLATEQTYAMLGEYLTNSEELEKHTCWYLIQKHIKMQFVAFLLQLNCVFF